MVLIIQKVGHVETCRKGKLTNQAFWDWQLAGYELTRQPNQTVESAAWLRQNGTCLVINACFGRCFWILLRTPLDWDLACFFSMDEYFKFGTRYYRWVHQYERNVRDLVIQNRYRMPTPKKEKKKDQVSYRRGFRQC